MTEYFEIAYAAASKRLCFFTGTGFSKALTENEIPSWQQLIEGVCDDHVQKPELKKALFPENGNNPLRLEEAAQIVGIDLASNGLSIHEIIAERISKAKLSGKIDSIKKFYSEKNFRVVTTNYDKLSEELAGPDCQSMCPGMPVPKSNSRVKVFHVHGSIDLPEQMVVTADDYFNFMHSETYFSRKLSTVLHENTVVVLGYSLGDVNLKNILSEYGGFMKDHFVGSSIFLVSHKSVDQPIRDYYATSFGIRVIDDTSVEEFFSALGKAYPTAEKVLERSIETMGKVLNDGAEFTDSFLKMENSFPEIISALGAQGKSLESPDVVKMFGDIIDKKKTLCGEKGAWEQYEHLASWLIILGSLIDIEGRSLEGSFLKAVLYSMEHMSKAQRLGYSWHAYKRWDSGWKNVRAKNRLLIRSYIENNSKDPDAARIVTRG